MLARRLVFLGTILLGVAVVLIHEMYSREQFRSVYEYDHGPSMVVYGKNQCPYTQAILQSLQDNAIPFTYKDLEKADTYSEIAVRLKQIGVIVSNSLIPVVEFDDNFFLQPEPGDIVKAYDEPEVYSRMLGSL